VRLGLYTGWLGIAFAAARVGVLLEEHALLTRAARLVRRSLALPRDRWAFDLMSGRAGAIVALLALQPMLDDASLVEAAARLGDELLVSAERSRGGSSWRSPGLRNQRNLTGLSHGVAGAAHALLALFSATGEVRYAAAARQALRYEQHWFDATVSNWPDFRGDPAASRGRAVAPAFSTFWCHGAPGIALARLRARAILGDAVWEAETRTAIATTCAMLEAALETGTGNFSLCHGLAGNADIVLQATRLLDQPGSGWQELCCRVARHGLDRHGNGAAPWPCGTHSGETPNLMLGLAGIGYFYLRLGCQATPSVEDHAAASLPIRPTMTLPPSPAAIARPNAAVRPGGSSASDQCSRSVAVQVTAWNSGNV